MNKSNPLSIRLKYAFWSIIIPLLFISLITTSSAQEAPYQPLTAPVPAKAGTRTITPDWLLDLPNFDCNNLHIIQWADNTHLIYSFLQKEETHKWKIYIMDLCTGEHKFLAEGSMPKPSPDGQWIAFPRGEGKEKQLWIISINGTDLKQLSQIPGGLGFYEYSFSFAWSPDSKQIALAHQAIMEPWEASDIQRSESKIYILDISTAQSKQIASIDGSIRDLSWFPNGKQLLFMKERIGYFYNTEEDQNWIQSLNVNNGQVRTLAHFDGLQQSLKPMASPDGRHIAFMYDADNPSSNYMRSIGIVSTDPIDNGKISTITRLTHEVQLRSPQWSRDGQYIYAIRILGVYDQIYKVNIKTGKLTQITNAPLNIEGCRLSPDGAQIAWAGQDAHGTRIIRIANSDGSNVRDLITTPSVPQDIALSEVREIEWEVPNYPEPMRGLLFLPLHYQEGTRYPLIIDIHGGGSGSSIGLEGGILVTTPLEWHMWTAKGYAVFVPEFRSSASFGSLAITRDEFQEHDIINRDVNDINAGVDALIARGIVDSDRLAVIGHSAGGRRANWLTVATHRYRAVISKEGWADDWMDSLKYPVSKRDKISFGGAPWEVPQNYLKNSALFHASGASTPTLFLHGNPKLGGSDSADTVRMLYNALKGQGVETEYIEYPDEGHVFEKPENRRNTLQKSIQWIDSHMKSSGKANR